LEKGKETKFPSGAWWRWQHYSTIRWVLPMNLS
jgi:hypothetical protein